MSERLPLASTAFVTERAKELVAGGSPRVLVLAARPRWSGSDVMSIAGARVHVRPAVSHLAALTALDECLDDEYLVLLTDRTESELGDAVVLRAHRQRVEPVDEWTAVTGLYDAHTLDPALPRCGSWVPAALLNHQPAEGWPRSASGVVTVDHALGNLLGSVLRLPLPVDLDLVSLLAALEAAHARSAWASAPDALRSGLSAWAADSLGSAAAMVLDAAARGHVSPTAIGLALDVLWPADGAEMVADQGPARGRIEGRISGRPIAPAAARAYADAARTLVLRLDLDHHSTVSAVLAQAEALLTDLGWAEGAERSSVLPAGLTARYRALAALLDDPSPEQSRRIDGALLNIVHHERASSRDAGVTAARMAVRVARWIAGRADHTLPAEMGAALQDYLHDGAWLDRAAAALYAGSADPEVAAAYGRLFDTARRLRGIADENAARLLAEATQQDATPNGGVLIERALDTLVRPIAKRARTLVILLDGMSAPVAVELAEGLAEKGWVEQIPQEANRVPVLAALPTLTRYSRTAFFTGALGDGGQNAEKAVMRERFNAPLFHKDDLRAPAGEVLPSAVRAALDDPHAPVVGVVLNTIDDALARHDPGGMRWGVDSVQHLPALLDAAALAGRAVILTSDHGHVVERGSEARPVAGADARWRPATSGVPGKDEVLVRGPRVAGGEAILPWREDVRYSSLRSGYHGGASLAEVTVPFLMFTRVGAPSIGGWRAAPPQAPAWWNETGRPGREARRVKRAGARIDLAPALPAVDGPQGTLDLGLPEAHIRPQAAPLPSGARADVISTALVASETYAAQRKRAGRRALDDAAVLTLVRTLISGGGRSHRDTLAGALQLPPSSFATTFAALARLLNVDGYAVVAMDADGVSARLEEGLLVEQFELGNVDG